MGKEALERLKEQYPIGCRVEMEITYKIQGNVTNIENDGMIKVNWDEDLESVLSLKEATNVTLNKI